MWLMTKHGFYSIVRKEHDEFHIRSREKLDIENLVKLVPLPGAEILESRTADYHFRVIVGQKEVMAVMEFIGRNIDYSNFKSCVDNTPGQTHKPYHEIWGVLADSLGAYGSKGSNREKFVDKGVMSEHQQHIERTYEEAKRGGWEQVLSMWRRTPSLAQECSRYQKPSSGWTFLHQAAYFGHEAACRELIRLGAAVDTLSRERQSAADVADERKYPALAALLRRASYGAESLWSPPKEPNLLPSSNLLEEAEERRAAGAMCVAYGGGVVKIPAGARYFADSFERTLVGWHGTYNPPCGMDSNPVVLLHGK
ncbi:MAG: ankyrin repeat domain-containing protein [Victivallales bacterium]|jgi:hypothetical protein